jgi:ribulose-phosphate 3-epimerase
MIDAIGSQAELEVHGGMNAATIRDVVRSGATVVVIGSAIYDARASVAENLRRMRSIAHA